MSSDSWTNSAHQERIKNRRQKLDEKRQERAEKNPAAFAWEKTDGGQYECQKCEKEYRKLPNCIRHIMNVHETEEERGEGQSSLGEWA